MRGVFGSTCAAFESRSFSILWSGAFLGFIAFFMSLPVQSVVTFDLTGRNSGVGWVIAGQGISQFILNPVGGALADRMSKRVILVACQSVMTVTWFALAGLIWFDAVSVPWLFAGSLVTGAAFSFLGPARQGLLVEFVPGHRRGNAIALSQVALNASRVLAPMAAGVFLAVSAVGAGWAYFAMGVFYVGAVVCTVVLPATPPADGVRRALLGELITGLRYVAAMPGLRTLIPSYILVIAVGFAYTAVLPGLVENEFGRKPSSITILLIANAIGGLAASLAVAARADSPSAVRVYTLACTLFGLSLVAAGLPPGFWALAAIMLVVGAAGGSFQTLVGAIVSHTTEPAYFGRVISLTFLAFAVSSIAGLPIGLLADAAGERFTVAASGGGVCVIVAAFVVAGRFSRPGFAPAVTPP